MVEPLFVRSFMNEDWPCGRGQFLQADMIKYRMQIYFRYTLPSLLAQTDQDFRIWLDCRPGSEGQIQPYLPALEEAKVLVTFDRGKAYLTQLPGSPSHFLLMRVDSDDCYAPDAVQLVKENHKQQKATIFDQGWIWLAKPRVLYPWKYHSPPFYTLRLEINEHGMVWPEHAGHNAVRDTFQAEVLPTGRFCVIRHEKHSAPRPPAPPKWIIREDTDEWRLVHTRFNLFAGPDYWNALGCKAAARLLYG
jgi:hypothetical protein